VAVTVAVRVTTGARKREMRWEEGSLKVKLTAPPVEGKANAELKRYLAETFEVKRSEVTIVRGERARHKFVAMPLDEKTFLERAGTLSGET
jgi:uncharacterized protein